MPVRLNLAKWFEIPATQRIHPEHLADRVPGSAIEMTTMQPSGDWQPLMGVVHDGLSDVASMRSEGSDDAWFLDAIDIEAPNAEIASTDEYVSAHSRDVSDITMSGSNDNWFELIEKLNISLTEDSSDIHKVADYFKAKIEAEQEAVP